MDENIKAALRNFILFVRCDELKKLYTKKQVEDLLLLSFEEVGITLLDIIEVPHE